MDLYIVTPEVLEDPGASEVDKWVEEVANQVIPTSKSSACRSPPTSASLKCKRSPRPRTPRSQWSQASSDLSSVGTPPDIDGMVDKFVYVPSTTGRNISPPCSTSSIFSQPEDKKVVMQYMQLLSRTEELYKYWVEREQQAMREIQEAQAKRMASEARLENEELALKKSYENQKRLMNELEVELKSAKEKVLNISKFRTEVEFDWETERGKIQYGWSVTNEKTNHSHKLDTLRTSVYRRL